MTEEQLWEIDRYLLNDPTLDREAFEQRMLEDESLSVAVASAVERLSMLSVAAEPVPGSMRAHGASVTSVPVIPGSIEGWFGHCLVPLQGC